MNDRDDRDDPGMPCPHMCGSSNEPGPWHMNDCPLYRRDEPEYDDTVDAMRYAVVAQAPVPAVLAMTAITGIDRGLVTARKLLTGVSVAFLVASFVGSRMEPAVGGWFTATVTGVGLLVAQLWLMFRRWGNDALSARLIDRFGAARFKAALPLMNEANQLLEDR